MLSFSLLLSILISHLLSPQLYAFMFMCGNIPNERAEGEASEHKMTKDNFR